ncbi:MAG TPA: hypothetical protein VMD03_10260 [Steroidobacteraceae bacterium]|nr:hypothetical protein [Steroidobacteraceae bacterium]
MEKVTARRARSPGNPVALDAHALGTLKYIRTSIEAAGVLAVPGSAGIGMGAIGLLAAVLAAQPGLARHWFEIWLGAGVGAFLCGSTLMIHQAASRGTALYRGPVRKFLLCLTPSLFAGAVITFVLWRQHAADSVPGVWLLLYGCGVAAASTMTVRPVGVMGALFIVLGVAALALPPQYSNLALGTGFGGLHFLFGIIIGRTRREP